MTVALWQQGASTQRPLSATDRKTSYLDERVMRTYVTPRHSFIEVPGLLVITAPCRRQSYDPECDDCCFVETGG